MRLQIAIRVEAGTVRLIPVGEIDLSCRAQLDEAVQYALRLPGAADVVVDLVQVRFIDSVGLGVLAQGYRSATAAGVRFRVANANGEVAHVLDITGLAEVLTAA